MSFMLQNFFFTLAKYLLIIGNWTEIIYLICNPTHSLHFVVPAFCMEQMLIALFHEFTHNLLK